MFHIFRSGLLSLALLLALFGAAQAQAHATPATTHCTGIMAVSHGHAPATGRCLTSAVAPRTANGAMILYTQSSWSGDYLVLPVIPSGFYNLTDFSYPSDCGTISGPPCHSWNDAMVSYWNLSTWCGWFFWDTNDHGPYFFFRSNQKINDVGTPWERNASSVAFC